MSEDDQSSGSFGPGVKTRTVEAITALVIFALGVLVVTDSIRVGRGWASDGPQAGFYPFYVGLILCACALWIFVQQLRTREQKRFVSLSQLRKVFAILVPAMIYVAAIYLLGIYLSSALFLFAFMIWQGKFSVWKALAVSLLVPIVMFLMFEVWFKVPLPKGPFEAWLGY
jgi:putative tricarboxylic transport membrane protein